MRIAILIRPIAHIFNNGLIQNAFFLYEALRLNGHTCSFLCYDPAYKKFQDIDVSIQTVSDPISDSAISEFNVLITAAIDISQETYNRCKRAGVRVIGFTCGNALANTMAGFVDRKNVTPSVFLGKTSPIDHIWLIGGHSYMKSFVELTRGAPSTLVPHVWSPSIIESYTENALKRKKEELYYKLGKKETKYNILILEPNIEIIKNAVIPITICERLNSVDPSAIHSVFVFGFPDESKTANALVNNCEIRSKMRYFKRLTIPEILLHFNSQPYPYIVVSHQINNPWNYVYYEMMHFGVPLVHNSDAFKSYGYYYENCDVNQGADACLNAMKYHTGLKPLHEKKNAAFLTTIDPYNPECQATWGKLLAAQMTQ